VDDCRQLSEFYEEYALGTLEGPEREEIERHLARACPTCTPGVEQARWLVAQLAYLAPDAAPPAGLRARIIAAATAEPEGEVTSRATVPRGAGVATFAPRPQRAPSAFPAWAWAAAAVLLLATFYSVVQQRRLDRQLAAVQRDLREGQAQRAAIESEREHYQMAMEILSAQDTKSLVLAPKKAAMPPVQAYWSPKMGLLVMSAGMPQMPSDMTLQLWMVSKKGQAMSIGIFRPDDAGHVMLVAAPGTPLAEIAALAISEEPAGGSPQPTSAPVWVGPLT
jgi:anti-sigma-K factor RskA